MKVFGTYPHYIDKLIIFRRGSITSGSTFFSSLYGIGSNIQYLTEVSTPLTFLYKLYYISSHCDNMEEMTLCYNVK